MSTEISIVGSGHTKFGRLQEDVEELIVAATREAVSEAGLDPADIDAVFLGHFNSGLVNDGFALSLIHQAYPELRFKPGMRAENACASGSAAIHAGLNAIQAGKARTVLVVGAEKMTSRSTQEVTNALAGAGYQNDPSEAALSFPQVFGVAACNYAARYSSPLDAMARIAVKNHANAMGLTQKGQGASALEEGTVYRDGTLPVNLSGGLKAKGHPVGATGVSMHVLAYRQLTHQAGGIQKLGAALGLVFNMGGSAVANYASVLEARKD